MPHQCSNSHCHEIHYDMDTLSCGCGWGFATIGDSVIHPHTGADHTIQDAGDFKLDINPECKMHHDPESLHNFVNSGALDGHPFFDGNGDGLSAKLEHEEAVDDCTDGDCPICMNWIPTNDKKGEYSGAMSRFNRDRDEPTEICSACGTAEAMMELSLVGFEDADLSDTIYDDWTLWKAGVLIQRDLLVVRIE
jgi:hypothetical protein